MVSQGPYHKLLSVAFFKIFLLGHKILKSTSVDCNKINIVTVMVRIMMCVGITG